MARDDLFVLVMVTVGVVYLLAHIGRALGWPVPGFFFGRLERMRRAWGERAWIWVHAISYCCCAFCAGLAHLYRAGLKERDCRLGD